MVRLDEFCDAVQMSYTSIMIFVLNKNYFLVLMILEPGVTWLYTGSSDENTEI